MPSPKDIKKVLNTAQGTKAAGKAMDLEELLGTLPKGSKAQQLEAELMFKRLAEEQAARYAPTNPPTKRGNAALAEAKKTLAKKQAPAVIIPSKISNVERAVRESRGEFGAKRVQRAADQIKNLDDQYTEEALRRAFAGDNTNLLMIGNPAEFKNFAAELIAPYRPGIEKYLWEMSNKNTRPSEIPLEARRQGNVVWEGGATDVPFLELNQKEGKLPFVSGHEGRHRNLAMEELGYPSTLWRMMPRAALREDFPRRDPEEYLNALIEHLGTREPLVVPEGKDWADAINLPELFAEGGGVHMAGGGKALKVLKGAGKAADATQDIQSIVSAGKPLTAAERAMVFSIGPRLFTLDQGVITRPDLHPAFPEILTGQDLDQLFVPVPNRIALPTFNEDFRARTGRKKPGYYELTNTPEGDPYPTQFVDEDYLNFLQKEGYAHGGPVHMAGGNEPGESIGEMFKPKPLTIPSPLTDMADAIRRQFSKEKRSMSKPGAATDILLRGPVAFAAGTPMDLVEMAGQGVDYLQTKIPSLRKKASVMDTGPEKTPPMGYAPKVQVSPNGTMPYGTEDFQNKLRQSGLTTDEERPLFELGTAITAPFAASKALKYGKALAPTAADIMETQLLRATEPMRMNIVPDGRPSGKLKAPANDLGFYNPAEKAALNLQRKKGTGATFVSDLKKQPGVNDERLTELGLGDLASRPNMTKEELLAATQENRIPLRETVSRERNQTAIDELESQYDDLTYELENLQNRDDLNPISIAKVESEIQRNINEQKRLKDIGPEARFGPATSPDYSLPGGENYREIRVGLPAKEKPQYFIAYKDGSTMGTGFASRADAEAELADLFGSRPDLEIRQGVDGRSMTSKTEDNFFHSTHHGDEPNVLFHLRVADHTDVEGKKGLLIDELQSDWHQKGRDKGYQGQLPEGAKVIYNNDINKYVVVKDGQTLDFGVTEQEAIKNASSKFGSVPDAPFKDNWYQLGLKRAIKEAADTGMDRVYLTTGARQADRYDLSKRVSYIDYRKSSVYNKYELGIADIDGDPINLPKERYSAEELPDIVGKEVADKIIKGEGESGGGRKTLRGLDLKIGGEGMKQYYDKTYKNFLDKYAKQFGARVGETKIPTDLAGNQWPNFRDWMEANYPDLVSRSMPYWYAGTSNAYVRAFQSTLSKKYEPVYYIDVTPKMRESTKKGQSYKDGGAVAMAAGGAVDYESRFNQMLQDHVAGMAEGGAVDYESRFNDMLQKHVQSMAEGGAVNEYNADPDMADGGRFIQAPAFAEGGAVKSIWTVN
jgi:hypothetical protein